MSSAKAGMEPGVKYILQCLKEWGPFGLMKKVYYYDEVKLGENGPDTYLTSCMTDHNGPKPYNFQPCILPGVILQKTIACALPCYGIILLKNGTIQ